MTLKRQKAAWLTNIKSDGFVGFFDQQLPVSAVLCTAFQTIHTLQIWAVVGILGVGEPAGTTGDISMKDMEYTTLLYICLDNCFWQRKQWWVKHFMVKSKKSRRSMKYQCFKIVLNYITWVNVLCYIPPLVIIEKGSIRA